MDNIELIKLRCPFCSATLTVKKRADIDMDKVAITCPVCKEKSPMRNFKRAVDRAAESTSFPEMDTINNLKVKGIIGTLRVLPAGQVFRLHEGRNVLGRKTSAADVDIPIDTMGGKRLSRQHLVIDVENVPGKGYMHYASLYKKEVNRTLIGSNPLEFGDKIVLNNGDVIALPDVNVIFQIEDNDRTSLQ